MVTDKQWRVLEPLINTCRPHAKVPSPHLRRTVEGILWRHENGAKWRALPAEFGPWWMAAQTFIRWSRLVERSFAWATRFRRLAKDYERYASTLADLHIVAFVCIMLRNIARLAAGQ